jgi:methyl-accepting chemotaxis protein
VEEQGAATQEISRNLQQRRKDGAAETGSAASQVLSAAQSLSADSSRLKVEVSKFLNSLRAA